MKKTIALLGAALLLTGCGRSDLEKQLEDENAALREKVTEFEYRIAEIGEKSNDMASASDDLVSEVARFGDENWKDVVPSVEAASEEIESAQDELSKAIEE